MSAYFIFIRDSTSDQTELATYGAMVSATFAGHSFTPLVQYGAFEVFEGREAEGVVVLRFATMDEAKAWYSSPAYQEAAKHRFAGAEYRAILVEGAD